MDHEYLSPMISDGTALGREPAITLAYSGTWSSRPGPDADHLIVMADVSDTDHATICAVDGVEALS